MNYQLRYIDVKLTNDYIPLLNENGEQIGLASFNKDGVMRIMVDNRDKLDFVVGNIRKMGITIGGKEWEEDLGRLKRSGKPSIIIYP